MAINDIRLSIVFESGVDKLTEVNSSFDRGVLKVAYHGRNRNGSYISKEAFEQSLPTIFNCPVVCNYQRETDSIGSHDVELVKTSSGMKIVNITQPVGVVPESAKCWWSVEEENGQTHEYLCTDVIIWKRQEAYEKIKTNKITDESMEITVKSGKMVDGCYHIDSFEFTAFCLLESAEPCFESASLELFSLDTFRNEYEKMIAEFKEQFAQVNTSSEDDIDTAGVNDSLLKGGTSLNRLELLAEYGLTVEELDFNLDDYELDELRTKFEAVKSAKEASASASSDAGTQTEGGVGTQTENPDSGNADNHYALAEQFLNELLDQLRSVTYSDPYWGEMCRYWYVDYDAELSEVYCYDCAEDYKLFGFTYSMNGDNVVIDFNSKTRKKFAIVSFDEGSADINYSLLFNAFGKAVTAKKDSELQSAQEELKTLRQFKESRDRETRKADEDSIFEKFSDLSGVAEFEALKDNCSEMTLAEIEGKCYELRGRNVDVANFALDKTKSTTRLPIDQHKGGNDNEPYGGLFLQFATDHN